MSSHNDDGRDRNEPLIGRRGALKLLGSGAIAATTGVLAGSASAQTTVDLGEQGLSEGDDIDSYLEEHFVSGNEVVVPSGTYTWNGGGFPGKDVSDATLRGDGGVVELDAGDGWEHTPDCYASGGTVLVENVAIRGKVGGSSSDPSDRGRFSFGASSGAKCVVRNFSMPDGSVEGTWGQGIYIGSDHGGELVFDGVDVRGMNNNGTYSGGSVSGPVHWKNCYFENNNIASIRISSSGSSVENCVVVVDSATDAPTNNMRGIWVREAADDVTIDDCDVYYANAGDGTGYPVEIKPSGGGGSGEFGTIRVYNDSDMDAINHESGDWDGETAHLTGDGALSAPEFFSTVNEGGDATEARSSLEDSGGSGNGSEGNDGSDGDGSDEETDDGSDDESDGELSNTLTIEGDGYDDPVEYVFAVSEAVEKGPDGDSDDTIDGTDVEGVVGGTDDYRFAGEITAFDASGPATVSVNGDEVDPATLGSSDGDGGDETDGGEEDSDDSDGSGGEDGDGSSGEDPSDGGGSDLQNTLTIDGTHYRGICGYSAEVSGDIVRDHERSSTANGDSPWDRVVDDVNGSSIVGMVGNGKDVYRFSGELVTLDLRGNAVIDVDDGN